MEAAIQPHAVGYSKREGGDEVSPEELAHFRGRVEAEMESLRQRVARAEEAPNKELARLGAAVDAMRAELRSLDRRVWVAIGAVGVIAALVKIVLPLLAK